MENEEKIPCDPIRSILMANFELWNEIPREKPMNFDQHRQKFFQTQAKIK